MGHPWNSLWVFSLLSIAFLTVPSNGFKITPNSNIIKMTKKDNVSILTMDENNHVEGANTFLLFTITDVTSYPSFIFLDPTRTFKYKIAIQDESYLFYAAQYFDYETQPSEYRLMDQNLNIIMLIITNIDDEQPTLTSPMCHFLANQIYDIDNTTCNCTVGDADGWLAQMTFTVVDSSENTNESQIFEFNYKEPPGDKVYEHPVYITLKQPLKYETRPFYSFTVNAKDGAKHSTKPNEDVRALIYVDDVNDKPPKWEQYDSTAKFLEKTNQILYVLAVDGNKGINAKINYTLSDENEEQCIKIDPYNGTILISPIDRDARDILTYEYTLTATKEDIPPRHTTIPITYYIEDIDDNAPLVVLLKDNEGNVIEAYTKDYSDAKVAYFKILENYNQTSLDLYITITDRDTGVNAQFNLALENVDNSKGAEDYTSAFYIVPNAGYKTGEYQINVKNVTKLDYEVPEWDHIQFYVHSTGVNNKSLEDRLLINIDLINYNDEIPKFSQTEYSATINETWGNGKFITQVLATDRDAEDKILNHELVGSTSIIDLMRIDSETGDIFVNKTNAFDFDKINPIIVQVKAIDKVEHSATVPLTINLLDVNNKAPTIDVEGIIRVDENQPYKTVLNTTITASDVDTTRKLTAKINWDSSYAMKNSQQLNNSNPDIVKLIRFLDLEYEITDNVGTITIHLVVNKETEVLPAPDFETFDTLYLSITVTDLNTDPDFIKCCQDTTAIITININDINDNPPIFTEATIKANRTAYEMADKGIIVGSILATDADVGDIVKYNCTCLDEDIERDWFAFDESSGEVTVIADKTISADKYPTQFTVEYNCTATDGTFYTPQTFFIYILDKNNKYPYYADSFENITINEQSPKNSLVTKINTTDADRDIPFHTVYCLLSNPNEECYDSFFIAPENSNAIQVKVGGDNLNRDTGTKSYECSVRCSDNPNREQNEDQLFNDTKFTITLNDINNNAPELVTTTVSVKENLLKDETIAKIQARDIDYGKNSEIDFTIVQVFRGKTAVKNEIFKFVILNDDYFVNDTIKCLTLVALEDLKDNYGEYTIHIKMTDRGIPMQTSEADLSVTIEKFNFYAPRFIFPGPENKTLVLNMDQPLYSQLTLHLSNENVPDLSITDDDDKTCSGKWNTKFKLDQIKPTGVSIFTINSSATEDTCSGQLQVNSYFNKEQAKDYTYQIILTATLKDGEPDEANGEKSFTATSSLAISFFNVDQEPIFNKSAGSWNFIMAEDDVSLVEPLPKELHAYYPNVPEDYTKYYFLQSSDKSLLNTFKVDENTGAVSLRKALTFLERRSYTFQIVASKDKSASSSSSDSTLDVNVNVNETNRHTPQWEQNNFFGAIMSTYKKGDNILTANASDLDEIDQGKLTYKRITSIERVGTNIDDVNDPAFNYDETTGDVTLNFVVNNAMNGYFWFNISVEDVKDWKGNGPHLNTTSVTIYIIAQDKNTVTFRFANQLDSVIKQQNKVLSIISESLDSNCIAAKVDHDSQNGQDLDNQTLANIYCIENSTALSSEEILKKLANLNTFQYLRTNLMNNCSVYLLAFSTESDPENLEEILKAALIGVSVLLGACCLILGITFFLKTRELNRRLKKLTEPKFGSDESDLNRKKIKGINAPNTNVHAVEGSNPVFNIGGMNDLDFGYEKASIHSGDSDLIGVEDRPEFDFFDSNNLINEKERF